MTFLNRLDIDEALQRDLVELKAAVAMHTSAWGHELLNHHGRTPDDGFLVQGIREFALATAVICLQKWKMWSDEDQRAWDAKKQAGKWAKNRFFM